MTVQAMSIVMAIMIAMAKSIAIAGLATPKAYECPCIHTFNNNKKNKQKKNKNKDNIMNLYCRNRR